MFPLHRPHVLIRVQVNQLGREIDFFAEYLVDRGYKRGVMQLYLQAIEHLGSWMRLRRISTGGLDEQVVSNFLSHLSECRCPRPASHETKALRASAHHFLRCLRNRGQIPCRATVNMTPVDREVWQFDNHLDQAGGLALNTRLYRRRYVRQFLSHLFGCGPFEPEKIKPRHVMDFAADQAATRKPGTAKVIVGALKSYFKYLQLRGLCGLQLLSAVPTIPFWKLAGIPKTIAAQDLERFLKTFDRSTATGRRDFAMALCMNECGLRVCEISQLHLRDINWRLGVLKVPKSKTHRSRHLPLTPRLGQAISDYLHNGRPNSSEQGLFLRHRAPYDPISDGIVRGALRRSYERSGATPWSGPHALRHTLAARLMEGGVPIKEVADVLGHTSIDTTAIYAKVNLAILKQVAMPWPKGGNS